MATIPSPYKLPSLHLTHILVYIIYIHTVHTYTLYIAKYVRLISSIVDFPTRCSPLIMKRCLLVYHPFNVISPPFLPSKSSSSTNFSSGSGAPPGNTFHPIPIYHHEISLFYPYPVVCLPHFINDIAIVQSFTPD